MCEKEGETESKRREWERIINRGRGGYEWEIEKKNVRERDRDLKMLSLKLKINAVQNMTRWGPLYFNGCT